jgi:hypothetical protein
MIGRESLMPEKISEEKRREIIGRMFLVGNAAKVAQTVGVSEATVRNVMKEVEAGRYPEYKQHLPRIDAISRLNRELEAAGRTVGEALVGFLILTMVRELSIEACDLLPILTMLKQVRGDTPPAAFGRAVGQLAKLHAETGLGFEQLEQLILTRRSDLDNLQTKVKVASDKLGSLEFKIVESEENLDRTLQQSGTTLELLEEYRSDKRTLLDAGLNFGEVKPVTAFIKAAKKGGFLERAKELVRLEFDTGMDFSTITAEYKRISTAVKKYREEEKHLINRTSELTRRITELTKEEAEQLNRNGITKERLDRYLAIVDRLKKAGINLDD